MKENPRVWHRCTVCDFYTDEFREGDSLDGFATYCCYSLAERVLVRATPEEVADLES